MTVIGLDDTDSRERGMCTTYLATRIAEAIAAAGGSVERRLLVRLNPAVEHKTRGNAALALHTDIEPDEAFAIACEELPDFAETADERTSPGIVVAPSDPADVPATVATFARDAVRDFHDLDDALSHIDAQGYRHRGWAGGRGRIGALAAIGAWTAFDEWTYEGIAYRQFERCGTLRDVDDDSVFDAADAGYPAVWDTIDRVEGQAVCVPHAPGPILYGIRGDDPDAIQDVLARIESEPVERQALFLTNQGTDAHLRDAAGRDLSLDDLRAGRAYRITGEVADDPETRQGGHVFVTLRDDAGATLPCVAFEPTKRFRDRVRALRPGDRITVCGEVSQNQASRGDARALKLEKFAVRDLVRTERVTPDCPDCGRSMKSAGRDQGYRCRDCGTRTDGKVEVAVDRSLELGWYEVPPCARRHIAKPLVRGGFDAPIHPER